MLRSLVQKIKRHRYKILAAVSFAAAGYFFYCTINNDKSIKMSAFLEALHGFQIDEISLKGDVIYFRSLGSDWYYTQLGSYPIEMLFQQIKSVSGLAFSCENEGLSLYTVSHIGINVGLLYYLYKMKNDFGKENYKRNLPQQRKETFQNFYGGEDVKRCLKETIEFIRNPQNYEGLGIRQRKGLLLHGPPGTGKTMLARILANEANMEFISASASEFEQIFVGVGPKRIRDIFLKARQVQNGCIIFIDEIDAIGSRSEGWQTKQQRSTINQLLTEMDGFLENNKIFLVGATNNISLVDPALLRPGRFDVKIFVPLPDEKTRAGILATQLQNKKMPHSLTSNQIGKLASLTEGWCGADLENLLNEGGYLAARSKQAQVSMAVLEEALVQLKANK